MKSKIREKFHLTIDEKTIMSFFVGTTTEGFSFGLILPKRDIHLTVFYNTENRLLHYHITDSLVPVGRRKQPIGKHIEIDMIGEELIQRLRPWFKKYHHNQKGWILKPVIKQKIQDIFLPKEQEKGIWNLPFYMELELPEFTDESCWTRVRLRDLINQPELVFIEGKTLIRYAFVIDSHRLLIASDIQFETLFDYIFKVLGFEDYFQYLKRKVPQKELIRP